MHYLDTLDIPCTRKDKIYREIRIFHEFLQDSFLLAVKILDYLTY